MKTKITRTFLHKNGYKKLDHYTYKKRRMIKRCGVGFFSAVVYIHFLGEHLCYVEGVEYGEVGLGLPETTKLFLIKDLKSFEQFIFLK